MKKVILAISILIFVVSCKKEEQASAPPFPGTDCSLTVSGVTFSKSINDADKNSVAAGDSIVINSAKGANYFNAPDGSRQEASAPILLTQVDNTKPFTFTAKLATKLLQTYDAGALYIYVDNTLWHKFAFEMDEFRRNRVVGVRTIGTSDDNNHDILAQDSVYMKISSNVKQIGFYYSVDNQNWNLARLYKNEYPASIWLGLSSQAPKGEAGNKSVFSGISLTENSVGNFRTGI